MQPPLPISAIIPIYNCRDRLVRHLRSVISWAPSVQEIIVVDSGSTDGSLETAKEVLSPLGAKFLHNPPGLYQSWNAGIAAATSPWCYIATVEDPIMQEGLLHLLEVAARHNAHVVISPPEMRNHDGTEPVDEKMPSNRLAEALLAAGMGDRSLNRSETISMLCGFLPHGLLGSSASNLYNTSFLQQYPFPTNFGHCGDTAWGVSVAPIANIAFTPRACAKFYSQTTFRAEDPERQLARHRQLADLARSSMRAQIALDPEISVMLGWFDAHDHSAQVLWKWLAEQNIYHEHLRAKYEGGIFQFLGRAIRDEWKKILFK